MLESLVTRLGFVIPAFFGTSWLINSNRQPIIGLESLAWSYLEPPCRVAQEHYLIPPSHDFLVAIVMMAKELEWNGVKKRGRIA